MFVSNFENSTDMSETCGITVYRSVKIPQSDCVHLLRDQGVDLGTQGDVPRLSSSCLFVVFDSVWWIEATKSHQTVASMAKRHQQFKRVFAL